MNGVCSLCCGQMEPGSLPFCESCQSELQSLPHDQRMKICLQICETESSRKLASATDNLSIQLQNLIQLSRELSPANRLTIPPPSRS